MTDFSPGSSLFKRSQEAFLQRYLELERQRLAADVIDSQLMSMAEEVIKEHNTTCLIAGQRQLVGEERRDFLSRVRGIMGGGALNPLLERHDVENIHILGHDRVILSLADGRRIPGPPVAASESELVTLIRHLAATAGHTSRRFDTSSPILDLRLASGHRLFAITAVAERTSVVIRRHRMLQSSLGQLQEYGTVTPEIRMVLRAAVRPPNPANLLVVGGTGAGKTTLLRSLLSEVPEDELLVTIEDTLELHLRSSGLHERTLALETRTSNTEGTGEISMYDLCKAALRMSPDRVIVGEVRGGEVMQLLQSMGIGNDGSLGTIHAGSTRAAINKMLIYAQRSPDAPTPDSVLREIAEVMHLLVYIKKLPDGRRAITSIREVTGYEEGRVITSEVFAPGPEGTAVYTKPFKPDGEPLARLVASGFNESALGAPASSLGQPDAPRLPQPQAPRPAPAPGRGLPRHPAARPRPARQPAPAARPTAQHPVPAARPPPRQPAPATRPPARQPAPAARPTAQHPAPATRPPPRQPAPATHPPPRQPAPATHPPPRQPAPGPAPAGYPPRPLPSPPPRQQPQQAPRQQPQQRPRQAPAPQQRPRPQPRQAPAPQQRPRPQPRQPPQTPQRKAG